MGAASVVLTIFLLMPGGGVKTQDQDGFASIAGCEASAEQIMLAWKGRVEATGGRAGWSCAAPL